jgi:hypothetical protein
MRTKWLWIGLALIALAVALTLAYGDVLREQLLRSIVYELWLWQLRLESLPFGLVWMVFLVMGSLGVYYTIIALVLHGRRRAAQHEHSSHAGLVQSLAHKIELACHGELARWNLHRVLSDIAIQWIMVRQGLIESEARRRFRAGEVLVELRDALTLEFPASPARRGWLWLSERFPPLRPAQKERRLQELSQLTSIVEQFAGEAYESARDRR